MAIKVKRIYEPAEKEDGFRFLVDRLWPRGLTKDGAQIDLWLKELSPSDILREWYNHDPQKWSEFQQRYANELQEYQEYISTLRHGAATHTITLLYGAKETEHNNAMALKNIIESKAEN